MHVLYVVVFQIILIELDVSFYFGYCIMGSINKIII